MMHDVGAKDGNRKIDWSLTSNDYEEHRPGFPPSFFERLHKAGLDFQGKRVLDLGCGTGHLTAAMSQRGARAKGRDIATGQIAVAKKNAEALGLDIDYQVAPAENTGLPKGTFDVISAAQCWLYFDKKVVVPEILRLLAPEGEVLICHMSWLPRQDPIARATEELVLTHNPDWSAADWSGLIPAHPLGTGERFRVKDRLVYDENLRFTREGWRGRIRACRGVGATLGPAEVRAFDAAHRDLLERSVPPQFEILHRIDAFILIPR
jgi:SAM-dependent methyltransferase